MSPNLANAESDLFCAVCVAHSTSSIVIVCNCQFQNKKTKIAEHWPKSVLILSIQFYSPSLCWHLKLLLFCAWSFHLFPKWRPRIFKKTTRFKAVKAVKAVKVEGWLVATQQLLDWLGQTWAKKNILLPSFKGRYPHHQIAGECNAARALSVHPPRDRQSWLHCKEKNIHRKHCNVIYIYIMLVLPSVLGVAV